MGTVCGTNGSGDWAYLETNQKGVVGLVTGRTQMPPLFYFQLLEELATVNVVCMLEVGRGAFKRLTNCIALL